jgi:hypothetical protein
MPTTHDANLGRLAKSMENATINDSSNMLTSGLELSFSVTLDDSENLEQLGPVIKNITETGKQTAFLEALDTLIRKKDGEIERMCNSHYQVHSRVS